MPEPGRTQEPPWRQPTPRAKKIDWACVAVVVVWLSFQYIYRG